MPTVSVIVPCYNARPYVASALQSVLDQTYTDWECIVVDDGSTDGAAGEVERFCRQDTRFCLLRQANQGVACARNAAIRAASGKYILPLDADDRIAPGYMQAAVAVLESNPGVTLVYGKGERFGTRPRPWPLPPFSMETMLARNCIFVSAFFRRADFDRTDGFDPAFRTGYEDWDFWLSLLEKCPGEVVQLPEVCFYYRTYRQSRNFGVDDAALADIRQRLWFKHKALYGTYFFDPLDSVEYHRLERRYRKASRMPLWRMRTALLRLIRSMTRGRKRPQG